MEASEAWAFRRATNIRCRLLDIPALRLASRMLLIYLYVRTWSIERDLPLLLVGASHSLLAEGLALLGVWAPSFYVRNRELLYSALCLQMTLVGHHLVIHGAWNIFGLHRGSSLALLLLLLVGNMVLYLALYFLHARLLVSWSRAALPLLAVVPIWNSRRTCARMLAVKSVREPLMRLYGVLTLVQLGQPEAQPPPDMCLLVNRWSILFFGVVLPLAGLYAMEQQSWQLHKLQLLEAHAEQEEEGWESHQHLLVAQQQLNELELDRNPLLPLSGSWVLDLYCASSLAWTLAFALPAQHVAT